MKWNIAAFLILLIFVSSCATTREVKDIQYQEAKNFRLAKLDMNEPEISMDLQFYNPNGFGLTLKDANVNLYINNAYIGKAFVSRSFDVPGRDTFLLPVTLIPDLKGVFPNALQLLFNKEVLVKLEGSVKAGRGLFITVPLHYEGRQKLNVF